MKTLKDNDLKCEYQFWNEVLKWKIRFGMEYQNGKSDLEWNIRMENQIWNGILEWKIKLKQKEGIFNDNLSFIRFDLFKQKLLKIY